jgi:hypothetical protein
VGDYLRGIIIFMDKAHGTSIKKPLVHVRGLDNEKIFEFLQRMERMVINFEIILIIFCFRWNSSVFCVIF